MKLLVPAQFKHVKMDAAGNHRVTPIPVAKKRVDPNSSKVALLRHNSDSDCSEGGFTQPVVEEVREAMKAVVDSTFSMSHRNKSSPSLRSSDYLGWGPKRNLTEILQSSKSNSCRYLGATEQSSVISSTSSKSSNCPTLSPSKNDTRSRNSLLNCPFHADADEESVEDDLFAQTTDECPLKNHASNSTAEMTVELTELEEDFSVPPSPRPLSRSDHQSRSGKDDLSIPKPNPLSVSSHSHRRTRRRSTMAMGTKSVDLETASPRRTSRRSSVACGKVASASSPMKASRQPRTPGASRRTVGRLMLSPGLARSEIKTTKDIFEAYDKIVNGFTDFGTDVSVSETTQRTRNAASQ